MSGVSVAHRRDDVDIERDRELVERAQNGDPDAFGDLYLRYFDRLCRFCVRRLGNVTEAEDAAQEAFAKAWKALDRFDGERRFYPWLSVIAGNVCTDVVRRRSRSTPVEEPDLDRVTTPIDGGVEDIVERAEAAMVEAALDRIFPRHREVLKLRENYEWSYQRIAEYQGVEISTVETLLFRARRALRREFMVLAEAQGALGAALLVVFRRAVGRTGKLLHVARMANVAHAGEAGAAAGGAAAGGAAAGGAAAGGAAAPAVAAAAGGAGLGAGLSGALVAGIVASLVAAGALTAAAFTTSSTPAKHVAAGVARVASVGSPASPGGAAASGGRPAASAAGGRSSRPKPAGAVTAATSGTGHHGSPSQSGLGSAVGTTVLGTAPVPATPATAAVGAVGAAVGSAVGAVAKSAQKVASAVQSTVNGVTGTVKKVLKKLKKVLPPLPPLPGASPTGTTGGGLLGGLG